MERAADRRPRLNAASAALLGAVLSVLAGSGCAGAVEPADLAKLRLPPGFAASIYATAPGARSMAIAPDLGIIFVGTRTDTLYAVPLHDGNGAPPQARELSSDLRVPNGIAYRDGWLYVAEQARIFRYRPTRERLAPHDIQVIYDKLPNRSHHGWRYAAIGPDGKLYVAVGAPCNICPIDGLEGTILRMDLDGGNSEIFARGVRNSVGFDFQPGSGTMYFTENGGDRLGNTIPPDELNRAARPGQHYGFPHFAGGRTVSPDFRSRPAPQDAVFPVVEFGAHVAALGIHFYRGNAFPQQYRRDAFVAEHGSWNREPPDGYRITRVRFDDSGQATGKEPFIEGFRQPDGDVWGRPVDVKELADGSLLVSDDHGGAIYRIAYRTQ